MILETEPEDMVLDTAIARHLQRYQNYLDHKSTTDVRFRGVPGLHLYADSRLHVDAPFSLADSGMIKMTIESMCIEPDKDKEEAMTETSFKTEWTYDRNSKNGIDDQLKLTHASDYPPTIPSVSDGLGHRACFKAYMKRSARCSGRTTRLKLVDTHPSRAASESVLDQDTTQRGG